MMGLANMLAVLTPREKWDALRAVPTEPLLDWWIWVPAVLAVAVGVGLVALYRHWSEGRQSARTLEEAAKTLGLDAEERVVLARVATASGVQHPQTVLTSEDAFNRGVARAAEARVNLAASKQSQQEMVALVKSVREKLGYEAIANTVAPQRTGGVPIPAGADVTIIRPGAVERPQATVLQAGPREIVVQSQTPLAATAGDRWHLRHVTQGMVWEFDAIVIDVARPTVRLRLAGTPRGTNYRRYIRAATRKPAYVALFPFLKEVAEGESLQFTSGTLIEIGGPGLRVIAPVRTDVGERVAVRVIMANQWSIQGIGTVRRSRPVGNGDWESVVEMTGLTEEELERLVRETNAAAKQAVAAEEVAVHTLVRN